MIDFDCQVSQSLLSLANYTPAASPSPRMQSPVSIGADNAAGITEINVYAPHIHVLATEREAGAGSAGAAVDHENGVGTRVLTQG